MMFSSLDFCLVMFVSLIPSIITQTLNCSSTTQTLCNGTYPYDNVPHAQQDCTTPIFSSVNLTSCDNDDPLMSIYWFSYDAVCRTNQTRSTIFAIVLTNGTRRCLNNPDSNITYESCERDYSFSRKTMTIHNITTTTQQKYICFLSNNGALMNYTSTKIYSITALEPTTTTITSSTIPNTTGGNIRNSTITENTSRGTPTDDSLVLKIVLPIVLGVVFIIVLILVGFLCYRRGRRQQVSEKPVSYKRKPPSPRTNQPSIPQRQEIYGEDITTEETDNNNGVWHLV